MRRAVLDTDTLSYYLKHRADVRTRAAIYIARFGRLEFGVISYYEVRRGLIHSGATSKLAAFERLAGDSELWPVCAKAAGEPSTICADLWQRGEPLPDADILIAAVARANGLVLVTNNTAHFSRIPGLELENWFG